jgi:tetratricopeptide (TPR) repeat protein
MNQRRRAAVLAFNLLLLPFCFWGMQGGDTDTFYHLAGGRWMFEHHQVLDRETFSFTIPGRPWANHFWLFECLIYGAYRYAGRIGLLLLRAALILTTANLLLLWIWRRTGRRWRETAAFGLIATALYLPRAVNLRPHLVSYLFLVLVLFALERFRARTTWIDVPLVLLCAAWANLHGVEFPVVLAVIALHAASALWPYRNGGLSRLWREREVVRWLLLSAACMAAFLVTPFGGRLFLTPGVSFDAEIMDQISEMRPISWESFADLTPYPAFTSLTPFRYASVAGALLLVFWLRRRQGLPAALFVMGAALAFTKSRFLPEFAILSVPFVAEGVATAGAEIRHATRLLGIALVAVAVYQATVTAAIGVESLRDGRTEWVSDRDCPVGPVRFLKQQAMAGNLFTDPGGAGYVTWELYPAVRIFADMRTFEARLLWVAQALHGPIPVSAVEERWPLDFLALHRTQPLLRRLLSDRSSHLAPVYADAEWVLLAHDRQLQGDRSRLRLQGLAAMEAIEAGGSVSAAEAEVALREAERLIAIAPDNHLAQDVRIAIGLSTQRLDEARQRAAELARRYPREPRYALLYARALLAAGQLAPAASALADVLGRDDSRVPPATAVVLAETYLRLDRTRAALDVMEDYRQRQEFRLNGSEHALLGKLRQRCGELTGAADAYERALWLIPEADPLRAAVENDLAAAYLDLNQPQRALELAEAALGRPNVPPTAALIRERAARAMEARR